MRNSGIIIFCLSLLVVGCKTSTVTRTSSAYHEDLSGLRPVLEDAKEDRRDTLTSPSTSSTTATFSRHIKDELDSVNRIIIERNKAQNYANGYTVQIYTGGDRQAANDALSKADSLYPDLDPQISYMQPSYKVKVGQYVDRLEAHQVFEEIKKEFPFALLIPERIIIQYDRSYSEY